MKYIFPLIVILFFFSCNTKNSSPSEKLKDEAEQVLKRSLNDPSSYEFVDFRIDTLMRNVLNVQILEIKKDIEIAKKDSIKNKKNIKTLRGLLKFTESRLPLKNRLEFIYEYRAKNKFGALILGRSKVISDENFNFIEIKENE
jgi:hypothetical protein